MESPEIDKRRRMKVLMEQIDAHPLRKAHVAWRSLNRVLQAYVTNADLLTDLIAAPESDPEMVNAFMRGDHEGGFRQHYYDELFRCLHNYLSILTTLIDHARNLKGQYEGTDFYSQYESRVATLLEFPGASFLKDLRNYLIHYSMVPLSVDITIRRIEPVTSFQVKLVSGSLLEGGRWNAASKAYLESHDEIVLRECVEEYTAQNIALYEWAFSQFETLHGENSDDYERLRNELRELEES